MNNNTDTIAGNRSDTKTASSSKKTPKVLFVASGNKKVGEVSSFVQSQYDSLVAEGLDMVLFPIKGKGWKGYLKAVFELRKVVKREKPDIIHAHYSTCGFVASLACLGMRKRPKIMVSILGSFPTKGAKWYLVRFAIKCLWHKTIVKSNRTAHQLGLNLPVIPNGVNLERFRLMDQAECRRQLGWNIDARRLDSSKSDAANMVKKKYIIWCSNPERKEKNWPLAEASVRQLESPISDASRKEPDGYSVELVAVYNKTPDEVCTYMNAADCLLLTSDSEGSPNVIKEAMACNCPIVTTDVGDVRERLANLEGCYVVEEPRAIDAEHTDATRSEKEKSVAEAIMKALEFGKRTEGRKRLIEDRLEISQIAKRIIEVYTSLN